MIRSERRRMPGRSGWAVVGLFLFLIPASPAPAADFLDPSHPLHAWLAGEVREGRMSREDALFSALQAVYAPAELDAGRTALNSVPLRCATPLLRAVDDHSVLVDPERRGRIVTWRDAPARRLPGALLLSAGGRFSIEYWETGTDSVDVTDVAPANGVPDFVESVAVALEQSWITEVDGLGFDAPATAGQPYEVQLRAIGSFGYVELDGAAPGGTRMVLRNSYEGVPANQDPDGSELGALRVSAAHEFRHAGQYATSGWSEPGLWVELDATWMEDQVYPLVNDYTRFLQSSSPISDPQLPLDQGSSGSYPECVLQHWIEVRRGTSAIKEYWERRRNFPAEPVLQSYDAALAASGAGLGSSFVDFATFNLQSGTLSGPGPGYVDAALYPDARIAESAAGLPARFGSAIPHLASKFYRIEGFADGDEVVRLRVRQPGTIQLDLRALTIRTNGTRVVTDLVTTTLDTTFVLPTPSRDLAELYVVVANGALASDVEWFFLDVEQSVPPPPDPQPVLADDWTTLELAVGQTRNLLVNLDNQAGPASSLAWAARAVEPPTVPAPRSIAGSTLSFDRLDYVPAEELEFSIGIYNGSTGFEYLAGLTLTLPEGVTPVGADALVGEFGPTLEYDGYDVPGSTMSWSDPDGGFGSVPGAGTALGRIRLAFADSLTGAIALDWTISGDGFGGGPHAVSGQTLLQGPATARVEVLSPFPVVAGIIGEPLEVHWVAPGPDPVSIEISRDDGQNWETVTAATANDGLWFWSVDGPPSELGRIRVNAPAGTSAPSARFPILQPVPFVSVSPASGVLAGMQSTTVLLTVDATGLTPGDYPVRLDLRDATTPAGATLDLVVEVRSSAVDAPVTGRTRVLGVRPNPFNPATTIRFELAESGPVELDVIDLRGRRVDRLVSSVLPAGLHAARWDGRDSRGAPVASGTYTYRLRAAGQTFTGKLSLIR